MINEINDITIKGGCFTEEAELNGICSNSFNIVYGRNGSGKSTIARAFNAIAHPDPSNVLEVSFNKSLTDEEKKNIHVFNEDFIDKNIRIKDELDAIFMAGQQVELDDQINDLTKAVSDNEEKLAKEKENEGNLKSKLTEINNSITQKLKNGGYAERGKDILGLKRKPPVSGPEDIEWCRTKAAGLNQADLSKQIYEKIARLSVSIDNTPIIWSVPSLPSSDLFDLANKLLVTALPKPRLAEHDSIVVRVATNAALNHYLHDANQHFKDEKLDFCPLCQRPIDHNYVDELMDRIASVLDETSKNYNKEIDDCIDKLTLVDVGILPKDFFKQECKDCELAVSKLNEYLEKKIKPSLKDKKNSLYTASAQLDKATFDTLTGNCKKAFDDLKSKIDKRDLDIQNIKDLKEETKDLNAKLACLECEPEFNARDVILKQLEDCNNEISRLENAIRTDNAKLSSLTAQSSNTVVAYNLINELLRIVFYGDDRLQLADYKGNGYRLLSHGNPVSAKSVSTGERNVIALAYFFTQMLTNQSKASAYNKEMLVVIDDPVSSFDTNNRYGIISMITNQIRDILNGNEGSKVLFLTHDIQTLNDLVVMRDKLRRGKKKVGDEWVVLPACLNLYNNKLEKQSKVRSNDYAERLNSVFEYARKDTVEHNDTIGNEIRSLMESYSTFMYRKGIDDVLGDRYILKSVPEEVRPMFRDIPARLMLNNSSHGSLYTDTPITEYGVMTPQELHQLARRLLMFLYWTNNSHLYAYLRDDDDKKMDIIKGWAREEIRRANTGAV